MRSDEALNMTVAGPATAKSYTGADLGVNNATVAAGATLTGTFVDVKGYNKVGVTVTCSRSFVFTIFGRINGQQSTAGVYVNNAAISLTGTAGQVFCEVISACFDECAVILTNTDGSNAATATANMTLLP